MTTMYDFTVAQPSGEPLSLWDLHGKVVVVVSIGRERPQSPHLVGLDQLARTFSAKGLEVLAFPAPPLERGTSAPTSQSLGVSFPVLAPVADDGSDAAPLFAWLTAEAAGVFGTTAVPDQTKWVIGRDGGVVARFAPADDAASLIRATQAALLAPVPPAPPRPAPPPGAAVESPIAVPTAGSEPVADDVVVKPPSDDAPLPGAPPTGAAITVPDLGHAPPADDVVVKPKADDGGEPKRAKTWDELVAETSASAPIAEAETGQGEGLMAISDELRELEMETRLIQEQQRGNKPPGV